MSISSENGRSTPRSSASSIRSSASIETTVTKLLMSTKHLLQILTQWSKGTATGKMVSDSYVQLGNDFKLVSRFFNHAKVDVSDLGDVPTQLRKVLEVTLREPASDDTLNKYLPSIREIIVNLLDKLKVKQAYLKQLRQEQQSPKSSHPKTTSVSSISPRSSATNSTYTSTANNKHNPTARTNSVTVENQPPKSNVVPEVNEGNDAEDDRDTSIKMSKVRNSRDQDALEQLKNGTNLQRRASKRYSAYHMAKLTNQLTSEAATGATLTKSPVPPTPSMFDIENNRSPKHTIESNELNNSPALATPANRSSEMFVDQTLLQGSYTVFLKLNGKTKKCVVPIINNMSSLRLLFVERFAYSPGGNTFPEIYMVDPQYNVAYELDEQDIKTIKDGSVLELHIDSELTIPKETIKELVTQMKEEISKSQIEILKQLKTTENQSSLKTSVSYGDSRKSLAESVGDEQSNSTVKNSTLDSTMDLSDVRRQLAIIKQIYSSNKSGFAESISNIKSKLEDFKSVSIGGNMGKKDYVEKSQSNLGEISDNLLTRVDDLQDIIEILRKDVAERGSNPTDKKLNSVSNELETAETDLTRMENYVATEKPHWKKIWEAELDRVCEEQQFLNLQEDLLFDLKEDLRKANETFNLIHLCCDEQQKNPIKARINPILPILRPGTFNQVREQVMVAVESINPNHEERVDALEKAEKLWEREKKYKDSDELKDELGNFVEKLNLKKSGAVEEIERLRREKDEANLRANFKGNIKL